MTNVKCSKACQSFRIEKKDMKFTGKIFHSMPFPMGWLARRYGGMGGKLELKRRNSSIFFQGFESEFFQNVPQKLGASPSKKVGEKC